MGNPDFQAIREDDFEQYHFEGLFDSYLNFNGEDLRNKWKSAIDSRLISPQFHAREHLNVGLWMKDLRAGKEDVRIAFDEQYFALKATTSSRFQRNYLAAHWAGSLDHLDQVNSILVDGLEKFEQCFGLQSNTFVACNYIWPEALEQTLSDCGVTHLQTQRGRVQPDPEKEGAPRIRRHYTGQKSRFGQSFGVRNVLFEPFLDDSESWTDAALSGIERAFKLNRPAVVSSHRANYASGMDSRQRDRNLRQLNGLLSGVVDKFPDVEFISAPELAELMAADSPV
jgi:hypothetical protein